MPLIVQEEKFKDFAEEGKALFSKHWNELALHKGARPLDMNYPKMEALNNTGIYVWFTARLDGELVGYASFFIDYHLRYKTWKMAANDTVFIRKGVRLHRGVIPTFFRRVEELIKAKGAKSILYFDKKHASRESVFSRFGYMPIEQVYEKVL